MAKIAIAEQAAVRKARQERAMAKTRKANL
jgi:hypothetical protein